MYFINVSLYLCVNLFFCKLVIWFVKNKVIKINEVLWVKLFVFINIVIFL